MARVDEVEGAAEPFGVEEEDGVASMVVAGAAELGVEREGFGSSLLGIGVLRAGADTAWGWLGGGSMREDPVLVLLCSCGFTSPGIRSTVLSAFGPVGGATARPDGTLGLAAAGAAGVVLTGTTAGACEVEGAITAGFDGVAAVAGGLVSGAGALQTLDPNAGTAAGGEDGRGAYLSLEASARLAIKASSLPGSRRDSFGVDDSTATDGRREYSSAC